MYSILSAVPYYHTGDTFGVGNKWQIENHFPIYTLQIHSLMFYTSKIIPYMVFYIYVLYLAEVKWHRKLVQTVKLTLHTAFTRDDNTAPAEITAFCISK